MREVDIYITYGFNTGMRELAEREPKMMKYAFFKILTELELPIVNLKFEQNKIYDDICETIVNEKFWVWFRNIVYDVFTNIVVDGEVLISINDFLVTSDYVLLKLKA